MSCARRSNPSRIVAAALLLLLLAAPLARAEDEVERSACDDNPCACAQDSRCWDFAFLSSGKHTRLGVKATLTRVTTHERDLLEPAALVSYAADIYRTRGLLSSHAYASFAIGGGGAGTEGAIGVGIDFGVRLPVTRVSGPVLRIGPHASLLGNDALQIALVEPLRLSAGFQRLVDDALLEGGLTASVLGHGRYAAFDLATSLGGSLALGHYIAARFDAFRFDGRVLYVQPAPFDHGAALTLVRLEACAHPGSVALCADLQLIDSSVAHPRRGERAARALYAGLSANLSP